MIFSSDSPWVPRNFTYSNATIIYGIYIIYIIYSISYIFMQLLSCRCVFVPTSNYPPWNEHRIWKNDGLEDDSIFLGFHFFNRELLDSGWQSTIWNRRNIPTKLGKEFSTQQHPPPPKKKKTPFHLSLGPTSKQKNKEKTPRVLQSSAHQSIFRGQEWLFFGLHGIRSNLVLV